MTVRQKNYRHNRMLGMDKYNAARSAGYSESMARQACVKIEPQAGITDLFEQAGATDKVLAKALTKIALTAMRPVSCNIYVDGSGKIKNRNEDGTFNDFIEVEDNMSRLQAIRQICDLKKIKTEKEDSGSSFETYFIELIKKRKVNFEEGEGLKITRVEHRALDQFMAK